jgi:hypothetical protein
VTLVPSKITMYLLDTIPKKKKIVELRIINHPSFTAVLTNKTRYPVSMNFNRVVTNVGDDKAVYRAYLENIPTGMRIRVKPRTLTFTRKN